MLASVLGSLAALASMAVTLALCYLFWRKRSTAKEAKDELEPLQVGGPAQSAQATPKGGAQTPQQPGKSVVELTRHNVEDRLYQGNAVASSLSLDKVNKAKIDSRTARDTKPGSSSSATMLQMLGGTEQRELSPLSAYSSASSWTQLKCFAQRIHPSASQDLRGTNGGPAYPLHPFLFKHLVMEDYDEVDTSEPLEPAGQIQFSLEYDFYKSTLVLRIIQGRDLPAKDIIGTSDPYVKVTLLPDKKRKLETKVKHRTLNPRWNETFYFEGFPLHKLQKSILHLNVYDWDRFSRDDPIGDVYLPLAQVDLTQKPTFWKALKPAETCKLGDLLVSLMYVPRTSELSIGFIKARKLKAKDITGASDPYVKVWLMRGEKRLEKHKTPVFKCTLNPVFNEVFTFIVSWEHIRETSLAITVMDWDHVGRNEPIGGIVLGSKTGPTESKHWGEMLTKPRTPVLQWHKLKPL